MAFIYTIAHPLSNDIVYVGCTQSLKARAQTHINTRAPKSEIAKWIINLRHSFLYPKIELLDICDEDEKLSSELYWIQQLQAWGFNLLNSYKTIKRTKKYKYPYVKKRKLVVISKDVSFRTNKWTTDTLKVGEVFYCEANKKNSLRTMLGQYINKFGLDVHIQLSKFDGQYIYEIHAGKKEKNETPYHFSKSGKKSRYVPSVKVAKIKVIKPPRCKYQYGDIGSTIELAPSSVASFKQMVRDINKKHNKNRYYNYALSGDIVIATRVEKEDVIHFTMRNKLTRTA